MYARVARFENVDVTQDRQVFDEVRERAMQYLESIPGWQGGMQLVDRESGTILNVHLFDSKENLEASEPKFDEMPQHLGDVVQRVAGRRTSVERFEIEASRLPASS